MKVGIPQTLIYYRYGKIFKKFLENIGIKVILSPKTNKKILNDSLKIAPSEVCLPIKLYFGHINAIKNKVDYLLLPRIVQEGESKYPCPRIKNITDIVNNMMENMPNTLEPVIDRNNTLEEALRKLGKTFTENKEKIEQAIQVSIKKEENKINFKKDKPTIAILSHPYHLHDEFLNGMLFKLLKNYNISIITNEQIPQKNKHKPLKKCFGHQNRKF